MRTLVIYFSKTGTTESVAKKIAQSLDADTYEIKEAVPYTKDDLNWRIATSRANREQGDISSRPDYVGDLPNLEQYNQIIIGHPTWWSRPPRIIQTIIENMNLEGKIVATFSTSGGSGYTESQKIMDSMLDKPIKGRVLSSKYSIDKWLNDSGLIK